MAKLQELNYWQDGETTELAVTTGPLPKKIDIAIVGGGYTGLSTALHLARAGRSVAVLEAGQIGHGCSSRNGGMVGPSFHKLGMAGLIDKYGETKALALMREGIVALDYCEEFIADEALDCDLQMRGRFRGARTLADYDATARECDWLNRTVGLPFDMVPKAEQSAEIGSDFYNGGVIYHRDGGIHPRKLVVALAQKAIEAGVSLYPNCAVTGMNRIANRAGTGTELNCTQGRLTASEVVLATNAYSDRRSNAMHRRVVQIATGAVATEPLDAALMVSLTPKGRMHGESGRIFMWYRPTPDGKRFIFGGRMGPIGASPAQRLAAIRASALRVFPQLESTGFSHVWSGDVAYTPDHTPHLGFEDGVWLAGGYCGSGVTRSLYFGMKLARRILGQPDAETAFDDLPFKPVPLKPFSGLGAELLTSWYAWRDARDLSKSKAV